MRDPAAAIVSPAARWRALAWLAPVLAVLAVYWPVLGLGFVWDDRPLYVDVPALRAAPWWAGVVGSVVADMYFFRPVALLTFKLQFLWFGESTVAAHAASLALHAANTLLVAALAARLAPGAPLRVLLAGLAYGLHPALIEPVSWMSCRFDLLVTFWLLLALHADLAIASRAGRAATLALLFLLALGSKEMAAPFPAVLLLFQLATRHRDTAWRALPGRLLRDEAWTYAALLLAGLAYAGARAAFVGGDLDHDADVVEALGGLAGHAAFVAETVLFHVRNAVWPFGTLNPLHPVDLAALPFTPRDVPTVAGAAALLAALGWGVWRRDPAVTLAAAALLALFPVLNVLPLSIARNVGHERYLTFPLTLVALAVALLRRPARLPVAPRTAALVGGAVAALWLGAAAANIRLTVPLWQSEVSLWTWAYAKNPQSDYAHHMLVLALLQAQEPDLARQQFPDPVPPSPYRATTQLEFARYLLETGDVEEGAEHLRRALAGYPPWHAQPPSPGAELRDYEAYRGYIAMGYAYLAAVEERAGRLDAARAAAALAAQYAPPAVDSAPAGSTNR